MCDNNQTQITHVILLGFQGPHSYKVPMFMVFLLIYIVILTGNLLIISLVTISSRLNTPMFFFVKHLALSDVILVTTIIPEMLHIVLIEKDTISLFCCILQLNIFSVSGFVQCFLLAIMSYDRYTAICNPLHYSSIMDAQLCLQLVIGCWSLVFIIISSETALLCQLHFCGPNHINHFYCDFDPLLQLSVSDKSMLKTLDFVIVFIVIFFSFGFIIITYLFIFITVLGIPSTLGRKKVFSTFSSHLAIVCTFYGTIVTVYMGPTDKHSLNSNKFRSLLFIVVIPLMNPIIYSFRNTELRKAVKTFLKEQRMKIAWLKQ